MCQINEETLLDLAQVAKFVDGVTCAIKKSGFEGLNKDDVIWIKKNSFKFEMQKIFLMQIKNEAYSLYCALEKGEKFKFEKLGLKYLSLISLPNTINKMAYLVYDSPNSELTKALLDSDLKDSGILTEKWNKSGTHRITIRWRDYIASINVLINYYQNVISNLSMSKPTSKIEESKSKSKVIEGGNDNENAIKS